MKARLLTTLFVMGCVVVAGFWHKSISTVIGLDDSVPPLPAQEQTRPTGELLERPHEETQREGFGGNQEASSPESSATGVLHGVVQDPNGGGLADVEVSVAWWPDGVLRAESKEEGQYRLEGIPLGQPIAVRAGWGSVPHGMMSGASHRGGKEGLAAHGVLWPFGPYDAVLVIPEGAPSRELDLCFLPITSLRGRVVRSSDQAPVEGTYVELIPWEGQQKAPYGGGDLSDERGEFEVKVQPGRFKVQFRPHQPREDPLSQLAYPQPLTVEMVPGQARDVGVIELGGGPYSIHGRVIDQYSRPVAGLWVLAFAAYEVVADEPRNTQGAHLGWALTKSDGTYTLHAMYPGEVGIQVAPSNYESGGEVTGKALARYAEPVSMHLVGDMYAFQAPDVIVQVSEPFKVKLVVQSNQVDADTTAWSVVMWSRGATPGERRNSKLATLRGPQDSIDWAIPTPSEALTVRLQEMHSDKVWERTVEPVPNGNVEWVVDW